MDAWDSLAKFDWNFFSIPAILHYTMGFLFAYAFPMKDANWEKVQPFIGIVIVGIVVYLSTMGRG